MIHQVGRRLRHAPRPARWAKAAPLAPECDQLVVAAVTLETAVGRARVSCDTVGWQGWSREFGQHAAGLRNGLRLQAQTRPARATTLRAYAREEEQRGQRAAARLNRVRSALTQPARARSALPRHPLRPSRRQASACAQRCPSRSSSRRVSSTALCSVFSVMRWRPRPWRNAAAPLMARLFDSVAPLVQAISHGRSPPPLRRPSVRRAAGIYLVNGTD